MTEQEANHQTPKEGIIWSSIRSLPFSRQVKGLHLAGKSVILTPAGLTVLLDGGLSPRSTTEWASCYYSRYTYSFHSSGYSFSFSLKVLGVRAIVLGFRVRVRVRVRIRIRGLGDQNYEVGFETMGTVTQNYANFDYSGISPHTPHLHACYKKCVHA